MSLNGENHLNTSNNEEDCLDTLVRYIQNEENEKTVEKALDICKNFDTENTGRVSLVDFINILSFNLERGKEDELEAIFLRIEKEFIIEKNIQSIEYAEIFEMIEFKTPLDHLSEQLSNRSDFSEKNLTEIIQSFCDSLEKSNFDM